MVLLKAALLGILQGLTEFLPISSTAHLLIVGRLIDFSDPGGIFNTTIQFGSILAVVWLYRRRLTLMVRGAANPVEQRFATMIVVAFIPALVAGLLLSDYVKTVLYASATVIAVSFIAGGVVMLLVERYRPRPTVTDASLTPLPKAFAVGASAQFVLLPTIAFLITQIFALTPEMAVGLMILSLCPGGPTSNLMTRYAHGDVALSISVNGVSSFAALFTMPLLVSLVVSHFLGAKAPPIDLGSLGLSMFMLTTLPVAVGMAVRHYAARLADRLDGPMRKLASILLLVFVVGTLATNWSLFVRSLPTLGPSVILLGCSLILLGLGLSRLAALGRPLPTPISIATGIQNSALGIPVGGLIAGPGVSEPAFSVPSGVYGVIMYLLVIPFTLWRRRMADRTYPAATGAAA